MRRFRKRAQEESYLDSKAEKLLRSRWPKLVEKAQDLWERFDELTSEYRNNNHWEDIRVFHWEFDIKVLYMVDFPAIVEDIPDDVFNDVLNMFLQRSFEEFARELLDKYSWIDKVYQVGRSGGWLAIVDEEMDDFENQLDHAETFFASPLKDTDVEEVISMLKDGFVSYGVVVSVNEDDVREELDKVEEKLNELDEILRVREKDLPKIEVDVVSAEKEIEKTLENPKFWESYLE